MKTETRLIHSKASKAIKTKFLSSGLYLCDLCDLLWDLVCISLGEFYQAVTSSRRQSALTHDQAVAWIQLWKRYEVKGITGSHVDLALELTQRFQVNYYDALIIAAAQLAGCPSLYSEDLNDAQEYDGIRVQNPFR
ncbi:MAG: PIN domain-containing protein [Verrucomicrobia bacterium]|nr:PIN domain-containing protein [Verrucomicrobiota bacterium]MBV8482318.1 PIN domain-containing protein [Verrucomicrobiota bacterium]